MQELIRKLDFKSVSALTVFMLLISSFAIAGQPSKYKLEFSTFFGGNSADLIRGIAVDLQGNIYVAGVAGSADFPRTIGSLQGETKGKGAMVAKFSPTGALIWSKVLDPNAAGEGSYFYSVKVDSAGYVYVAGHIHPGFPTTPGAFQPTTNHVCGFVGKIKPDASAWEWCSYCGTGAAVRDMTMDDNGDIYGVLDCFKESTETLPASWFTNAYDKTPNTGTMDHFGHCDAGVIKISNAGTVLWATWIGGTNGNDWVASLAVGPDHCPLIFMNTGSLDMPITAGAFGKTPAAGGYLAKLTANGSNLIFGTYSGCSGACFPRTHNMALDRQGNAFIACCTKATFPVTSGAFQKKFGGGPEDFGILKISPEGALLAATYLGGNGDEVNGPDQVFVDADNNIMICGSTSAIDYPVTANAFQAHNAGFYDGVVSILSNDLSTLLYSSYWGGDSDDMLRAGYLAPDGSLYVGGVSGSGNFPVLNAYQSANHGPVPLRNMYHDWGNGDGVLAKFSPAGFNQVRPGR